MLRQLDSNLWVLDRSFRTFGFEIGGRMTVVRLPSGGLWIHSPVRTTPAERNQLDRLGPVEHVVAPNLVHHLFVPELLSLYPEARLHIAPGLGEKVPLLVAGKLLGDTPDAAWGGAIRCRFIAGQPRINETVFLVGRTLIVTDLAFNVTHAAGAWSRLFLAIDGALGGVRATRIVRMMIQDRARFRSSVEAVLAWDFDRMVVTHGDVVMQDARPALRDAYRFLEA